MSSWLKTGKESAALQKQEEVEAQKRKEEQGKMFRFFIKQDEEARITFVDGALDGNGYLTPPRFYEHGIKVAGKFETYACPEKTAPESGDKCPICASGDRPYLVSLFTIIDHREIPSNDGTKTYKDTPKLLALKPTGFELIAHKAKKNGGLAGKTYDVSRLGENAVATGDVYDFVESNTIEDLQEKYKRETSDGKGNKVVKSFFVPADYEKEIVFRTGDELRELGLGVVTASKGSTKSDKAYTPPSQQYIEDNKDYSAEL